MSGKGPPVECLAGRLGTGIFSGSPLLVFYEVTRACDLPCADSSTCAQREPDGAELKTDESLGLIDQISEFPDSPLLILTGGDPLKRPDLFRLIRHAGWCGLQVSVTARATPLWTAEAITRLRAAGISRMEIGIDGADATTHDSIRGVRGSFDRSLGILAEARARAIPTQVNTTLTPRNFDQIEAMAELLAQQEIAMWSVSFPVPVGKAAAAPRLSAEEYEIAFARLWQRTRQQSYAIDTANAAHYRRYAIQHQIPPSTKSSVSGPTAYIPLRINDGRGVMFIGHTGLIYPSGVLPMVCGMYPLDHLVRVYQQSGIFRSLRNPDCLEGKCKLCEFREICGGSRARAYAVTGNLFAQEPDCCVIVQARV